MTLWGYEIPDDCLECNEPVGPDRDVVVQGPDKKPIGVVHEECVEELGDDHRE